MSKKQGLASRAAATIVMTRVVDDGRGLDGLLSTRHGPVQFRNLSASDQALVRAILTSAFRHRGEIEHAFSQLLDRPLPRGARHLLHTLHVAAAQILYLDVPDSAAVDLAVTALREDKRSTRFAGLANAILRRLVREKETLFAGLSEDTRAEMNMAPWLRQRTRKAFGKARLPAIARAHMLEPALDLTVKHNPELWAQKLGGVVLFGNSIRLVRDGRIEEWEGYDQGGWWVQDAAAHIPAHLLGDIAGKRVADLCAAPGGKTAQLIMAGAKVTALEASADRLERLNNNLARLRLTAECIHADMMNWQPDEPFDAILLDAPCSSTGTIRRHPDVQWAKSPALVEELALLQKSMIIRAARFLKPGGTLVFANCSLDRTEGEDVYQSIVAGKFGLDPDPVTQSEIFGLEGLVTGQGTIRSLPCHLADVSPPAGTSIDPRRFCGLDGFFAARFTRNSDAPGEGSAIKDA